MLQQQLPESGLHKHSLLPSQAHFSLIQFVQVHFELLQAILLIYNSNQFLKNKFKFSTIYNLSNVIPLTFAGTALSIILGLAKLRLFIIFAYSSFELT